MSVCQVVTVCQFRLRDFTSPACGLRCNKLLNLLANPAHANILYCLVVQIQAKVHIQFVLLVWHKIGQKSYKYSPSSEHFSGADAGLKQGRVVNCRCPPTGQQTRYVTDQVIWAKFEPWKASSLPKAFNNTLTQFAINTFTKLSALSLSVRWL